MSGTNVEGQRDGGAVFARRVSRHLQAQFRQAQEVVQRGQRDGDIDWLAGGGVLPVEPRGGLLAPPLRVGERPRRAVGADITGTGERQVVGQVGVEEAVIQSARVVVAGPQ